LVIISGTVEYDDVDNVIDVKKNVPENKIKNVKKRKKYVTKIKNVCKR